MSEFIVLPEEYASKRERWRDAIAGVPTRAPMT